MHCLFSFLYYNIHKRLTKVKLKNTYLMLCHIKKLSFVSCLELNPGRGAQYCRSSGTKSKVLRFEIETHSVLVQLPSGVKKIFSVYSFVLLGQLVMSLHRKCTNVKSGY
jgi:ribosomal protein L2